MHKRAEKDQPQHYQPDPPRGTSPVQLWSCEWRNTPLLVSSGVRTVLKLIRVTIRAKSLSLLLRLSLSCVYFFPALACLFYSFPRHISILVIVKCIVL